MTGYNAGPAPCTCAHMQASHAGVRLRPLPEHAGPDWQSGLHACQSCPAVAQLSQAPRMRTCRPCVLAAHACARPCMCPPMHAYATCCRSAQCLEYVLTTSCRPVPLHVAKVTLHPTSLLSCLLCCSASPRHLRDGPAGCGEATAQAGKALALRSTGVRGGLVGRRG